MEARTVIEVKNLSRTFQTGRTAVHAVRQVSLTAQAGEFIAIMGASGSGKSSFMNLLGCLDRPTSGAYRLDGQDVSRLDGDALAAVRNRKLGFVFQGFNLLNRTSALENVQLPLLYAARPLASRAMRAQAARVLDQVGLGQRLSHVPAELSGGQQQRVAIARALVLDPPVLLADEPTGNLDTRTSVEIMEIFQRLNDAGTTILMVTHELDIARYARRTVVMRDGRIVSDTPVGHRLFARDELPRLAREEAEALAAGVPS